MALRFRRPTVVAARIPTASMADIAFLLLIFFLTTTIFRIESGLEVDLPDAVSGEETARAGFTHIWMDRAGRLMVDAEAIAEEDLEGRLASKLRRLGGEMIVSLQVDGEVPYGQVDRVLARLKRANVRNVTFATERRPAGIGGGTVP